MGRYYFDTSALVKNYHAEAGTADVQRMLREAGSEFFISRLATVEMLSGFAGKVRVGVFSSGHFDSFACGSSPTSEGGWCDRSGS